jgi:hypothetical protein
MKRLTRIPKWNLRNSAFSVRVRANGNTASIRMYLEHTTQLRRVQRTGKCSHLRLEDVVLQCSVIFKFNISQIWCNCILFTKNQHQLVALYYLFLTVLFISYFVLWRVSSWRNRPSSRRILSCMQRLCHLNY